MPYIHIDMDEFTDEELLEECRCRGINDDLMDLNTQGIDADEMRMLLTAIWEKRRLGKDFDAELDKMIYYGLGRVI